MHKNQDVLPAVHHTSHITVLLKEQDFSSFRSRRRPLLFLVSLAPSANDGSLPEVPHGHPFPTQDFPFRISHATSAAGSHS